MPTTPNPAQVEYMRSQRHPLPGSQCTICGEHSWAATELCPAHHAEDAREILRNLRWTLADLQDLRIDAGDCLPPDLFAEVAVATDPHAVLARIRAELEALGA